MALNILKTRELYESRKAQSGGRTRFVNEIRHGLGLCDEGGNDYKDDAGNRVLGQRYMRAEQFSLMESAEAIIGPRWRQVFDPSSPGRMFAALTASSLVQAANPGDRRALLEGVGVGADPSQFQDINTWTAIAGGLIEVKFLEGWENPAFIADDLMPAMPTKMLGGQKIIGLGRVGNKAIVRKPNEATQRAGFDERYVTTPPTDERALAIDITNEAVLTDLTGDMLQKAEEVGYWVAWAKELLCLDLFLGVTNTYSYKGTSYNTYLTSGNWINKVTGNELLTWEQIQTVILTFANMTDQETGTRVVIQPDTLLVMPAKVATARLVLDAYDTEFRNSLGATQATAPTLSVRRSTGNPYQGMFNVLSSVLAYQRATDSTGLSLSSTNANIYWWAFEKGKAFKYMQVFPLTVIPAPPNSYDMIDRNIVASYFARERGIPAVIEPRKVIVSTN